MKRGSMQSKIPPAIREQLSEDPFMRECICFHIAIEPCEGRIEWQHSFTYRGKRINELYTILPMCQKHHKEQAKFRDMQEWFTKRRINQFNAKEQFLKDYPKSDLFKV